VDDAIRVVGKILSFLGVLANLIGTALAVVEFLA